MEKKLKQNNKFPKVVRCILRRWQLCEPNRIWIRTTMLLKVLLLVYIRIIVLYINSRWTRYTSESKTTTSNKIQKLFQFFVWFYISTKIGVWIDNSSNETGHIANSISSQFQYSEQRFPLIYLYNFLTIKASMATEAATLWVGKWRFENILLLKNKFNVILALGVIFGSKFSLNTFVKSKLKNKITKRWTEYRRALFHSSNCVSIIHFKSFKSSSIQINSSNQSLVSLDDSNAFAWCNLGLLYASNGRKSIESIITKIDYVSL